MRAISALHSGKRRGAIIGVLAAVLSFHSGVEGAGERSSGEDATRGGRLESQQQGRPEIGEKLFDQSECRNCHSIHHEGSEVGPDLTQVGIRRSPEWLQAFIFAPEEQFPDTKMPQFPWKTKQQVADVVAFLLSLKTPVDREPIFQKGKSEVETGRLLVEAYDCRACHIIGDGGRPRYPNLTHIGSKIYREWEYYWLLDPQKIKRGTFMPTFGFSEQEASSIAAYLESLK